MTLKIAAFALASAIAPAAFVIGSLAQVANFEEIDIDGNGVLSKAEFADAYPAVNAAVFIAADGDRDGTLSEVEHDVAMDAGLLRRAG